MPERKKEKPSDWELEAPLDLSATLEELIDSLPFREASDEHGHSVTAGTRIPQWLNRRIISLREARGSPYELNSDVLRDAVWLGLRILHMREKMGVDWDVETKLAAAIDATGASKRIKQQVDELTAGIEELYRDGDEEQAAEKLTEYVMVAAGLENSWHREKVFKLLQDSRTIREVAKFCKEFVRDLILRKGKK